MQQAVPVYVHPKRNSYAVYGSYSYEINPKWTSILGLRYTVIDDSNQGSTCVDPSIPIVALYQ